MNERIICKWNRKCVHLCDRNDFCLAFSEGFFYLVFFKWILPNPKPGKWCTTIPCLVSNCCVCVVLLVCWQLKAWCNCMSMRALSTSCSFAVHIASFLILIPRNAAKIPWIPWAIDKWCGWRWWSWISFYVVVFDDLFCWNRISTKRQLFYSFFIMIRVHCVRLYFPSICRQYGICTTTYPMCQQWSKIHLDSISTACLWFKCIFLVYQTWCTIQ